MKKEALLVIICILLFANPGRGQTLEKGIWYLKQKQFISARRTFESLLNTNPANARAMYYLGQTYYILNTPILQNTFITRD